jgi:magnesium transporter
VTGRSSLDGLARVRLFDAEGRDREVALRSGIAGGLGDNQLLWVDIDRRDRHELEQIGDALDLPDQVANDLAGDRDGAELRRFASFVRLTVVTLEEAEGKLRRASLDILAGRSVIVTVHDNGSAVVAEAFEELRGETRVGALDAAAMLGVLVDVALRGYFREVEQIERTIDELDEQALRPTGVADGVLSELVTIRHRLAVIRRALAPHRDAFAHMARPDFELHDELGRPWPGLLDRFERAMDAIESAWVFLVGSFDIYIGRAAQRSNDVMKVLTLLSAVLLPAVVLAGIFGMNFQLAMFDNPANVWLVIGAMVALAVAILTAARWKRWL